MVDPLAGEIRPQKLEWLNSEKNTAICQMTACCLI